MSSYTTSNAKTKVRFILPGGGIRATFQIAFIDEMLSTGLFEVDRVYGTSAGGILTPFVAAHDTKEALRILEGIRKPSDVFESYPLVPSFVGAVVAFFTFGMFKKNSLIDKIVAYFKGKEDVYNKCEVVAWDMMNKKERWFTGPELPIGLRATSALWIVTPPVEYEDTLYVDGGVTELLPVTRILENPKDDDEFDGIYMVVECSKRGQKLTSKPKNLIELMITLQMDSIDQLATKELGVLHTKLGSKIFIVDPEISVFNSPIDMDKKKIQDAIVHGRAMFKKWFRESFLVSAGESLDFLYQ